MSYLQTTTPKIHNITKLLWNSCSIIRRSTTSSLMLWHEDLNTEHKLNIEEHWSKEVAHKQSNVKTMKPYYVLPMFPYPSGNLHMGHVRVYSISDTIARLQKLNGNDVIHPIGWDAFGLPAENAAIERNIPPHQWTKTNIESMKKQLQQLGFGFDWDREISTCDPMYYKWTQYIFLKLFENGLAYQSNAQVNWDPVDKTVLADEQVDDLGFSWRSGAKVEKKYLTQWFIKTTKYAKKLYDGLNSKYLDNWKDIINLQKHWIGDCDGVVVTFKINVGNDTKMFEVWTSEPYKFLHGDFLTMSTNHALIHELKDKENLVLTTYNPITETEMPVYISDDVNYPNGRYVLIACSSKNLEDKQIASSLNISVMENDKAIDFAYENQRAVDIAQSKNVGGHFVSSKLKDWLISRQRYWGTPIPIIHCTKCGAVPVPYHDLPVKLPEINTQVGNQTLENLKDWMNCKCPKCLGDAKRETDTMDTFVDSSWYYYRFLDPNNDEMPFNKDKVLNHTPVAIYVGGKEHAVLHLYYARFMSYFLNTLGWTPTEEPFKKLLVQGMVMGQSYKLKSSGKYIPVEKVEKIDNDYKEKHTGESVSVQWEKMSKSKYNGENPERLLTTYGCDTTRLLMLADVPPATTRRWSDATLPGVLNWQHRLWITIREFLKHRNNITELSGLSKEEFDKFEQKIWESRNYLTTTATYHFKYTQKLSVGISRLQSLTNTLRNNIPPEIFAKSKEFELALAVLIIMMSPVTPHFCSELWAGFRSAPHRVCEHSHLINWQKNILDQTWPTVDAEYPLSVLCKCCHATASIWWHLNGLDPPQKYHSLDKNRREAVTLHYCVSSDCGYSWAKVITYHLMVDGADRCDIKLKASDLIHLNEEKALKMMLSEESVQKRIKTGILRTKYEWYPDCRAILHIFTNKKQKPVQVEQDI